MTGQLGLLLALRVRLLLRLGRGFWWRLMVGFGLLAVLATALWLGWVAYAMTRHLGATVSPGMLREWVHLVYLFVWMSLALLPLLGFVGSDFADVTKLFHFPVRAGTVLQAQVAAQSFGGMALFVLPTLLGVALGLPGGAGTVILRLLVALSFPVHAAVVSQVLKLLLLDTLRSRRFRDLAAVLAAVLSAGAYLSFRLLFNSPNWPESLGKALGAGVSAWLAPLPPLWFSGVIGPGAGFGHVALFVLGAVPLTALLAFLGAALTERAIHSTVPVASPRREGGRKTEGRAESRALAWLPGPTRAVAGLEYTLLRREPALRALLIQQTVFVLVPIAFAVVKLRVGGGMLLQLAAYGGYMMLLVESQLVFNLFGLGGAGATHLFAAPAPRRQLLLGKLCAHLLLWECANVLVLALLLTALALKGQPVAVSQAVAFFCLWTTGLLLLLGVGAVVSVLAPYPLGSESRRTLAQGSAGRTGCLRVLVRFGGLLALAALLAPAHALLVRPALAPVGVLAGLAFLAAGTAAAVRLLPGREERMLSALLRQ